MLPLAVAVIVWVAHNCAPFTYVFTEFIFIVHIIRYQVPTVSVCVCVRVEAVLPSKAVNESSRVHQVLAYLYSNCLPAFLIQENRLYATQDAGAVVMFTHHQKVLCHAVEVSISAAALLNHFVVFVAPKSAQLENFPAVKVVTPLFVRVLLFHDESIALPLASSKCHAQMMLVDNGILYKLVLGYCYTIPNCIRIVTLKSNPKHGRYNSSSWESNRCTRKARSPSNSTSRSIIGNLKHYHISCNWCSCESR